MTIYYAELWYCPYGPSITVGVFSTLENAQAACFSHAEVYKSPLYWEQMPGGEHRAEADDGNYYWIYPMALDKVMRDEQ